MELNRFDISRLLAATFSGNVGKPTTWQRLAPNELGDFLQATVEVFAFAQPFPFAVTVRVC